MTGKNDYVPRSGSGRGQPSPLSQIENYLRDGEALVWADRAGPLALAKGNFLTFLFGIPFFAFAVFWTVSAHQAGAPLVFVIFGVPFMLVGLSLVGSPLWFYVKGLYTLYAITDQRALIVCSFPRLIIKSFDPADIDNMELMLKADGSGSIVFQRRSIFDRLNRRQTWETGFFGIPDAKAVEAELARLRASRR